MMGPKAYELTDYPAIFQNTYWGSFECVEADKAGVIIKNRNKFVKEFNIVPSVGYDGCFDDLILFCQSQHLLDHMEFYRTANGDTIMVISLYDCDAVKAKKLKGLGFREYDPLYSMYHGCVTVIWYSQKRPTTETEKAGKVKSRRASTPPRPPMVFIGTAVPQIVYKRGDEVAVLNLMEELKIITRKFYS